MADSQQAEVAEEKQQEPVPSSGEQSTEMNQSQQVADESQEASEAPAGDSEELELPDGVKERTSEQFDKLKEQLRQTREELLQIRDSVAPKKEEAVKPLYDPTTGLVDIEALEQLRKDAAEAKKELANLKRQGADKEVIDLYESHPELNPNAKKFNQDLFDEAERLWMHSQAHPEKYGGKALTQKQAADRAKAKMNVPKPTESSDSEKQQASAQASGRPSQAVAKTTSEEEMEQLRFGTRVGDKGSMIARMRMIREGK